MAIVFGQCQIRTLSKTQSTIALSVAEAEFCAMVHGASEGLGAQAMARYFWLRLGPQLLVDAGAAIRVAQRQGLGKVRHLDTQSLWIQHALRECRVSLEKAAGSENPCDMMAKALDAAQPSKLMQMAGLVVLEGRPSLAPQLVQGPGGALDGVELGGLVSDYAVRGSTYFCCVLSWGPGVES